MVSDDDVKKVKWGGVEAGVGGAGVRDGNADDDSFKALTCPV